MISVIDALTCRSDISLNPHLSWSGMHVLRPPVPGQDRRADCNKTVVAGLTFLFLIFMMQT